MPLVSVVMPVYNGARFLAEAIESILTQTFTDFEFIIVDDGSQDRSAEIIRQYAERDERVRFIQLERNVGSADARNHGLAIASGEYIAVMDSDDVCLPQRLQKQVDHLRRNPEIGLLGTKATAVDQSLIPFHHYDPPTEHVSIIAALFIGLPFIHPTLMIRRDLLSSIGGYQGGQRNAEEVAVWSGLMWRTRFANLPESLLFYRWHDAQLHVTKDPKLREEARLARETLLESLLGEAPPATMRRLKRLRRREKLNWLERRLTRRDVERLIEAIIASELLEPKDRTALIAEMNMSLERTSPRLWQMFCHWRRHRFGR